MFSLITDDNDFQLEQAASAQSAALKLGAGVQIIYSGNDAVQQTQQILGFIQDPAKRPDAILAEPVGTAMAQIAKAAVGAGIAWGIINTDVDYLSDLRRHALVPVFTVLSNHETIGKIQGQPVAALLSDQGCVLSLEGPSVRGPRQSSHQRDARGQAASNRSENAQGRLDAEQRLPRR